MRYVNLDAWWEEKTNPIQTQTNPIKANTNPYRLYPLYGCFYSPQNLGPAFFLRPAPSPCRGNFYRGFQCIACRPRIGGAYWFMLTPIDTVEPANRVSARTQIHNYNRRVSIHAVCFLLFSIPYSSSPPTVHTPHRYCCLSSNVSYSRYRPLR